MPRQPSSAQAMGHLFSCVLTMKLSRTVFCLSLLSATEVRGFLKVHTLLDSVELDEATSVEMPLVGAQSDGEGGFSSQNQQAVMCSSFIKCVQRMTGVHF